MANQENNTGVIKATLTDAEMMALLNAAGLKPSRVSPLVKMTGQPAPLESLKFSGFLDNAGRLTAGCQEALAILANPTSETDLIWGGPQDINLSKVYEAAGLDKLVSFTSLNGKNNIAYFLSLQDIADLAEQRLAFTEVKNSAPLNIEVAPAALPVFFALLDTYRETQLKTALERRQETAVTANIEDLNRLIQEAKMETNYGWYLPAALGAMPLDIAITEVTVNEGFDLLKKEKIIGGGGEFSDGLNAFAYRAFPLAGFFGIKVLAGSNGSLEKTQLALFRGLGTLLLVQLAEENNQKQAIISSISTSQLPELLFNLGVLQSAATVPALAATQPTPATAPKTGKTVFCSKCGTQNDSTAKFCIKCGAPVASAAVTKAGPKFCPKCGDPITPNEKFCDKCGTALQ